MTDKKKTLSDTRNRFDAYQKSSDSPLFLKAKKLATLHQNELAFGSCCALALLTCGVFISTSLAYFVSEQTNEHIADKKLDASLQQLNMVLTFDPFSDASRFNRARVLGKLKRRQDAVNDLNVVLQHNPRNISALEHRSAELILLGQYDKAFDDCTKLVDMQKEHASVYTYANRAVASAMLGKNQQALDDYSRAIRMKPKESSFYLGRANVYREMKQYSDAIEDLEWVAMLSPGNVEGMIMQSQIYTVQKNYPKALAKLNECLKANPTNSRIYLERGKFVWARTHSKDALSDFSKAVALDSKNNDALLELMHLNTGLHNDKEALKAANLLVMNNYSTYEVQMTRADLEKDEKRYAIAELGYDLAAQLKPENVEPLVKKAIVMAEQKKFDQSADLITRALAIRPSDPVLLINRADYERHAKKFDQAQTDYEKALAINPNLTDGHMGYGVNYCEQGDYKNAKTEFETVLRAKPKAPDVINFLAFANRGLTNFGRLHSASTSMSASSSSSGSAPSLDPKVRALVATGSFDDVLKAGVARYNSGSYAAAINLLSRAVTLNPNTASARRYLARSLAAGGYANEAISQYRAVVEQEPGNVDDLKTMAKVSTDSHQYEDAIDAYQKLLAVQPNDLDANCGLIEAYKGAGMNRKAQEICQAAIRSANGLKEVARYEGLMNSMAGNHAAAKKHQIPMDAPKVDIQG